MGHVLAAVAPHADGDNALDIPRLVAHGVDVEDVKETCVCHSRVPGIPRMLHELMPSSCDEGPNSATH
jgi:hypothetical protein